MFRDGLNALLNVAFGENFSQQRDIPREIAFLDEGVGPDRPHDFVAVNQVPTAPYKEQQVLRGIHLEVAELIELLFHRVDRAPNDFRRISLDFPQDFTSAPELIKTLVRTLFSGVDAHRFSRASDVTEC